MSSHNLILLLVTPSIWILIFTDYFWYCLLVCLLAALIIVAHQISNLSLPEQDRKDINTNKHGQIQAEELAMENTSIEQYPEIKLPILSDNVISLNNTVKAIRSECLENSKLTQSLHTENTDVLNKQINVIEKTNGNLSVEVGRLRKPTTDETGKSLTNPIREDILETELVSDEIALCHDIHVKQVVACTFYNKISKRKFMKLKEKLKQYNIQQRNIYDVDNTLIQ